MSHRRAAAVPCLALTALLVSGTSACTDSGGRGSDPVSDPRSYVRDYDSDQDGDLAYAIPDMASGDSGGVSEPPMPPGLLEDNTFVDEGQSGFVDATEDPLSTFGLDVDTGSWSTGQLLLAEGHRPPPASIRAEEWVNAFEPGYPEPSGTDLGLTVDGAPAPHADDGTVLVRVGVQGRAVDDADRPPVALTFVVDTSGSMDIRNRLGLVQSSLALLVNALRPGDSIGIVTYSTRAEVVLEPTRVADADEIVDAIDELRPSGSTNMAGGLRRGYELAEQAYVEGGLNTVVLASDGVANVGTTDPADLAASVQDRAEQGIHLATVGYGMGNYNDHTMEQLADGGDGFYSYVDTFAEAERLFVDDLGSLLTVVADDAKAQVSFDPELVEDYRLVGYRNRALSDGAIDDPDADAGEIGAGHSVTALYELRLAAGVPAGTEVGTVDLRWTSTADRAAAQLQAPVIVPEPDAATDGSLGVAATAASLAELLRGDTVVAGRGVTLDDLATDAAALQQAGAPGADLLVETVQAVQQAD